MLSTYVKNISYVNNSDKIIKIINRWTLSTILKLYKYEKNGGIWGTMNKPKEKLNLLKFRTFATTFMYILK